MAITGTSERRADELHQLRRHQQQKVLGHFKQQCLRKVMNKTAELDKPLALQPAQGELTS
jgi:hypothetical protein